jgi:hypothetical protein
MQLRTVVFCVSVFLLLSGALSTCPFPNAPLVLGLDGTSLLVPWN